jgi:MFS family permease
VIALILCGYLGDKYGNRLLISTSGLWISTLGMLLIVCLPLQNNIGRLFGYYLTQASPTPFVALLSLISTNVAGYTKKTTVAAIYLIGYCTGNIIGPQTFRPKDAPRYIPAEIVIVSFSNDITQHIWILTFASFRLYAISSASSTLYLSTGTASAKTQREPPLAHRHHTSNWKIRNGWISQIARTPNSSTPCRVCLDNIYRQDFLWI